MVVTLYEFHGSVGLSDLKSSNRPMPVVTSVIEVNQRPLEVAKWIFGSLMKSVEGTPKNESSRKVRTSTPCFVDIEPRTYTISTTWFGPTATWTSGGVRRFEYGPFVPKWRPSKEKTGSAASGLGAADPVWTRRIPLPPPWLIESTFNGNRVGSSDATVAWPG